MYTMIKNIITISLVGIVTLSCVTNKRIDKVSVNEINEYSNPILQGFYPDPSICKAGSNYYMVHSTFAYFPGIPIFESNDLVNWTQIGNVLDRPEQLDLEGLDVSRGVFAPAISYHKGIYYLVGTIVKGGNNFIVSATDPAGPWSNPIWIPEVKGIDPSLFFDNEKTFIVYNSVPPDGKPMYKGHRTIRMYEFDIEKGKVLGAPIILVNGGSDISKKPNWIEGPHIYKRNKYYYLMAAEGGTYENHSEVVFRSKNVTGPYTSYENNPILTQRHLDPNRPNPIVSTGHADIVEDNYGNWWGVFLGCRPYEGNYYNTGRETFMAPVKWVDNWPIFDLGGDIVKRSYPTPNNAKKQKQSFKNSGKYIYKEEFEKSELGYEWLFLRTPREKWHTISNGTISIKTRPESASKKQNPSFIGYRQQHINGSVSAEMDFKTLKENEKSGLVIFQNETHYYYMCKSISNDRPVVQLFQSKKDTLELLIEKPVISKSSLQLKIEANGAHYNFYYADENENWKPLQLDVDARFLSTQEAGGFVGAIYGMYTTSLGEKSDNTARFNWFEIENLD